jgi:hypothetical protein
VGIRSLDAVHVGAANSWAGLVLWARRLEHGNTGQTKRRRPIRNGCTLHRVGAWLSGPRSDSNPRWARTVALGRSSKPFSIFTKKFQLIQPDPYCKIYKRYFHSSKISQIYMVVDKLKSNIFPSSNKFKFQMDCEIKIQESNPI